MLLFLAGCYRNPTPDPSEYFAHVVEADGSHSFYWGTSVAKRLEENQLETREYLVLQVPDALVQEALFEPLQTRTIPLWEPYEGVLIRARIGFGGPGGLETRTFRPGDPWFTGLAQVHVRDDGQIIGLIDAIKYTRHPGGNITEDSFTTGLAPDPNAPPVKYVGNSSQWLPTIPSHWL